MKKLAAVSLALLVSLSSAACDQDTDDDSMDSPDQYLQASSTITQCPGMAPEVVQMDITDAASGVAMAANQKEEFHGRCGSLRLRLRGANSNGGWPRMSTREVPSWRYDVGRKPRGEHVIDAVVPSIIFSMIKY